MIVTDKIKFTYSWWIQRRKHCKFCFPKGIYKMHLEDLLNRPWSLYKSHKTTTTTTTNKINHNNDFFCQVCSTFIVSMVALIRDMVMLKSLSYIITAPWKTLLGLSHNSSNSTLKNGEHPKYYLMIIPSKSIKLCGCSQKSRAMCTWHVRTRIYLPKSAPEKARYNKSRTM